MAFSGVARRSKVGPLLLGAVFGAVFCAVATAACDEGETKEKVAAVIAIDAAAALPNPAIGKRPQDLTYEATISGLTRFMRDLRVAIMSKDEPATGLMIASLRLQDYDSWMTTTFGNDLGRALSAQYKPQSEEIGLLVEVLREQFDKGLTEIDVGRYQTKENPSSTGYQSAAIGKMINAAPLYSVRLASKDRKQSFHIWSFVHDKGSFRFVGKLQAVATKRALGGRDLNEYRISDAERLAAASDKAPAK